MPEVPSGNRNRWFRLRRPGELTPIDAFAERFFSSQVEALTYFDRRQAERPDVFLPVPSTEDTSVWAVCVEPA